MYFSTLPPLRSEDIYDAAPHVHTAENAESDDDDEEALEPPAALVLMLRKSLKSRSNHLIRLGHPLDR